MIFQSINPYTQEVVAEYQGLAFPQIDEALTQAEKAFQSWKRTSFSHRAEIVRKAATLLRENAHHYARLITLEMGKVFTEAQAEIEKCALVCEYYAENAERFLTEEFIETDFQESKIVHQPIGAVFAIMPWNFPFWQVFRYAVPALMAGNVTLLKHAPNVFGCAKELDQLWKEAGAPQGVFRSLLMHHDASERVIAHPVVQGVTLTGSNLAGSSVASLAGKYIKRSVLELGGSDPFIVLADADIETAAQLAIKSRMNNCGQTCIAAKRFLVEEAVADRFIEKVISEIRQLTLGDPFLPTTTTGPMARIDLAQKLRQQIEKSVALGAELVIGGTQEGTRVEPGLLMAVSTEMPAFKEEMFGPMAAVTVVKSAEEAIELANATPFGLGANLFTADLEKARHLALQLDTGNVFVNAFVKSDPRLPFGGTKHSGYGRELSVHGMKEFVNIKTIAIQ